MGKYNHSLMNPIYSDWHIGRCSSISYCSDIDEAMTNSPTRVMFERIWMEERHNAIKCFTDIKSPVEININNGEYKPSYAMMVFQNQMPSTPFYTVVMTVSERVLNIYRNEFPQKQDWKNDPRFEKEHPSFIVFDIFGIKKEMNENEYIGFIG